MAHVMTTVLGRIGRAERIAVLALVLALAMPFLTRDPALVSLLTQMMIGIMGALSVYIMLRMDLMLFAVPAFMAIGGYTAAILGTRFGITDLGLLTLACFGLPFLVAVPLGMLVLRMRGVYFVLVTFVLAEIMPLLLFETPALTGGSNGISGLPAVTFLSYSFMDNNAVLLMITGLALLAVGVTVALTARFGDRFDSIRENEILAQSLGLVVWRYKLLAFAVAAGIAGLGGFALVELLITAHPSSFSAMSSVSYVAYAVVGGHAVILGPIIGAVLLVWATNVFSLQAELSQGLFGILLMVAVIFARGGIAGTALRAGALLRRGAAPLRKLQERSQS